MTADRLAAIPETILSFQGKHALSVWSPREIKHPWTYLHNDAGPFDYIMGYRHKETGAVTYSRAKTVPAARAISWAAATLTGKSKRPLAYVPSPSNGRNSSRWGGFDFDAHDGNNGRAHRLALAAFRELLNHDFATVFETSGIGENGGTGWHVWSIANDFFPVSVWTTLLAGIARKIGAPIVEGVCELFPAGNEGFAKGMRAPGAWNPKTGGFSEIYHETCGELLRKIETSVSGNCARNSSDSYLIKKETSLSLSSSQSQGLNIDLDARFMIAQPATRRAQLKRLVGDAFYQVARSVAARQARMQFEAKTVSTNATLTEHLEEFQALWSGMERLWLAQLAAAERAALDSLRTEGEQDAFRIIWSYERKAADDGKPDFPIVRDNLGKRLGMSGPGAGKLRRNFATVRGIIRETVPFKPNVAAARFEWLAKGWKA